MPSTLRLCRWTDRLGLVGILWQPVAMAAVLVLIYLLDVVG